MSGLMSLCPCLFSGGYSREEDFKLLGGNLQTATNPATAAGVVRNDRGSWLDESDELAAYCFKCGKEFGLGERHHCRRCGSTFCAQCSQKKMPLFLYGVETPERVCDACASALSVENVLATKHLPLLQRGVTLGLRSSSIMGTLTGDKDMALVKLRKRNGGDALVVLDQNSVSEDAPRHLITLVSIGSVEETPPSTIFLRDNDNRQILKLYSPTPSERADFAQAIRAAANYARAPNLAKTVDHHREQQRMERQLRQAQQERERQIRDRKSSNAQLRDNIRSKYNLDKK
mmetsp:Transcript_1250/g.1574  ORF Transcript_1250/g.1574 Transcript_1250/m.1574 type:complete len:288 (-) Transcript_1250:246-1109(-)